MRIKLHYVFAEKNALYCIVDKARTALQADCFHCIGTAISSSYYKYWHHENFGIVKRFEVGVRLKALFKCKPFTILKNVGRYDLRLKAD